MSAFTAISSMIELAVIIFLIYGFYKEDKFIAFEQKVKMIIVVNYRRYKRKKRVEQMRKNREFKLVDGGRKGAERGSFHVAYSSISI